MEKGIDVVEDIPFGDAVVMIMRSELLQRPIGDILPPVAAVFSCVGWAKPTLCGKIS